MESISFFSVIIIGGISIIALLVAQYSLTAVFDTMQYFMVRLEKSRNLK